MVSKAPLTTKEMELLVFFEQQWLLNGGVPSRDVAGEAGFSHTDYQRAIKSVPFREALIVRGISVRGLDPDIPNPGGNYRLTEEQLVLANMLLDTTDNRSRKKKLADLGISSAKYEAFLRDPIFSGYLRERAENLLGDNLHESHLALIERVRSGDVSAIKYYNELTGRYVPSSTGSVDVQGILLSVLEIIQRNVQNPETLSRISEELLALSAGNRAPVGPTSVRLPRVIEQSTEPTKGSVNY